jgi:hypothetical protein
MQFGYLGRRFGLRPGGRAGSVIVPGTIVAGGGSYLWTGQDATLTIMAQRSVAADAGSYVWTGDDATPVQNHIIAGAGSSYAWTGQDATLTASGGSLGLQTDLGSFFSLDNTLADATGNVTDLTNNNTVTFVTPPGAGLAAVTNCANFVGSSSQYLSHADATGINTAGISFSLQVWVYATTTASNLSSKDGGGFGSREYTLRCPFSGGSVPFRAETNNGGAITSANLAGSTWRHVVFTYNASTNAMVLYVDGASAATGSSSADGAGTSTLYIGADSTPGGFYTGNLALYGTWRNRVLSAGDVTALYNSGNGLSYAAMA